MDKLIKHYKKLGQGLIEIIVSVGLIMLVLGGVVTLLVTTMGTKNKNFNRKIATEYGQTLMEEQVNLSKTDADFYNSSESIVSFGEYTGTIKRTKVEDGTISACDGGKCTNVKITITWQEDRSKTVSFERFFARN